MKIIKKITVLILTIIMCVQLIPFTAVPVLAAANIGPTGGKFIAPIEPIADKTGWTAISSRTELENIKNNLSGKYYLTADIDLSGKEWVPIGNNSSSGSSRFTGEFDGQGYVIKKLTIGSSDSPKDIQYAGLFGYTDGATIKNVGLKGTYINISYSSSSSSSYTSSYTGGICGSGSSISNCYNTGDVSSYTSTYTSTYSPATSPFSTSYAGGICGYSFSIINCYWNSGNEQKVNDTSQDPKKGVGDGEDTTTPLTPEQMKQQSSFSDFDFGTIWGFQEGIKILKAFHYSIAVTGVELSKTAASIMVGRSERLRATVAPSNAANKAVTWSSSNASVATVDGGKVTAVAVGTATVTVTTDDHGYFIGY